jgi:hypothetical protein
MAGCVARALPLAERKHEHAYVSVEDQGIGMGQEEVDVGSGSTSVWRHTSASGLFAQPAWKAGFSWRRCGARLPRRRSEEAESPGVNVFCFTNTD